MGGEKEALLALTKALLLEVAEHTDNRTTRERNMLDLEKENMELKLRVAKLLARNRQLKDDLELIHP